MAQALQDLENQLHAIEQRGDDIQFLQDAIGRLPTLVQAVLEDDSVEADPAERAIRQAQRVIESLQQKFLDEVESLGVGLKKIQKNRQSLAKYMEHNKASR